MAAQHLLDQPQARGAAYALEDQRGFAAPVGDLDLGQRFGARGRRGARVVIGAEARLRDGGENRLAAGAAEPAAAGDRLTAVEAAAQEMAMRCPAPFAFFGSVRLSRPSLYSAFTVAASTSAGSVKLRLAMP